MNYVFFIFLFLASMELKSEEPFLDEESLYLEAFGEKLTSENALYGVFIDGKKLKEINLTIQSGDHLIEDTVIFKEILGKYFKNEALVFLDEYEKIKIEDLKKYSLDYELNHERLALFIIPKAKQRLRSFDNFSDQNFLEVNTNKSWSLFTNHFYNYNQSTNDLDYHGDFGLNISDIVLEGEYSRKANERFSFEKVTLVKDLRRPSLRIQGGDIIHSRSGVMEGLKGGGISIIKEQSLRPELKTRKNNEYSFFLDRPAWVSIFINKRIYQKKSYPAGEHIISGFSLPRGVSKIELKIRYLDGQVETLEFGEAYDYSLLRKGYSDFQISYFDDELSLGRDFKNKFHNTKNFSSNFGYGIGQNLSLFNQLNFSDNFSLIGLEGRYASILGNMSLATGLSSLRKSSKRGYAVDLGWYYQYHNKSNLGLGGISVNLSHESKDFSPKYNFSPNVSDMWTFDANAQFRIENQWNVSLNYGRKWGIGEQEKIQLKVGKRFSKNWTSSLSFIKERFNNDEDYTLSLSFDYINDKKPIELNGTLHSNGDHSLNAGYESVSSLPGYGVDLGYVKSNDRENLSLSGNYDNPYFTARSDTQWDSDTEKFKNQLNIGHALVMVDGKFALSRPIFGSFSIFELNEFEKSRRVKMNADEEGNYQAKLGGLPIAIGNLTPYVGNNFEINNFDIKPGEEVENDSTFIVPSYKSGNVIKISRKSKFYIKAKFSYKEKSLTNVVVDVLDENRKSLTQAFCDETGEVLIEGLGDGDYILDFGDYAPEKSIKIKGDGDEVLDLGHIILR